GLSLDEKAFLQTLAVFGREFTLPLIRQVASGKETELERMLTDLQHGEFIYEQPAFPDTEYTFKHALTQEVAYASVLLERRKQLHERVARAIEDVFQSRLDEHYSELVRHHSQSDDRQKAVKYLQLAGQQGIQRSAYTEAITYLTNGLELLKILPNTPEIATQELALQLALGTAFTATKGWASPELETVYTRARHLCQQLGETPQLFPVLWGLFVLFVVRGQPDITAELAEQLFILARRVQDPTLLAVA